MAGISLKVGILMLMLMLIMGMGMVAAVKGEKEVFEVVGEVYCDTCRAGFKTLVSTPIQGTTVKIQCKDKAASVLSLDAEGVTNKDGKFVIRVKVEQETHDKETYWMSAVSSPPPCNILSDDHDLPDPLSLTHNNGISSDQKQRMVGPFSFTRPTTLPACESVLQKYHIYDDDDD